MAEVIIYTRDGCGYCVRAKALLTRKNAAFTEFNATVDPSKRAEMMERSGRSTFPQIFINGEHIGGCDDLYELDFDGGLAPLLA